MCPRPLRKCYKVIFDPFSHGRSPPWFTALDDERRGPSVCMTAKGLRQGIGAAERDDIFQGPVPVARWVPGCAGTTPPRAQFEISVDGKPRSYRDQKAVAIEAAEYLKGKFPNSKVTVKDFASGKETAVAYKLEATLRQKRGGEA